LLLAGCAQHPTAADTVSPLVNRASPGLSLSNGLLLNSSVPFTGRIFTLAPDNGDTLEVAGFLHGREHGVWRRYYPGHQLMECRYFSNGIKTDTLLAWWPNGKLKYRYFFRNGEYEGDAQEWTASGFLWKHFHYRNGYEEGSQRLWWDDGRVRANYVVKQGRRYGLIGQKQCRNIF
jgi:antitoxin component YwqK of YwqJK toxin-antitoxin module